MEKELKLKVSTGEKLQKAPPSPPIPLPHPEDGYGTHALEKMF